VSRTACILTSIFYDLWVKGLLGVTNCEQTVTNEKKKQRPLTLSRVAKKPCSKPRIVTNEEGFFVTRC